ncbi:hypothetical protein Pelo_14297 [Pelomyxa schiedti]|nr:hypothetical protein Pelo_14297 [Pelomyxa schiedti]
MARCGALSPAAALPLHIVADEIGASFVMQVDRSVVATGYGAFWGGAVRWGVAHAGGGEALGGCPHRGRVRVARRRLGARRGSGPDVFEVVDFWHAGAVLELVRLWSCSSLGGTKGRKWVVLYDRSGESGVVDVRGGYRWEGMISDDDVCVWTVIGSMVLFIDLAKTYASGQLVVRQSFPSSEMETVDPVVFPIKGHKLIFAGRDYIATWEDCSGHMRIWSLAVIHNYPKPSYAQKVDYTHVAEVGYTHVTAGRNRTISVFSIDDFEHPVRVFPDVGVGCLIVENGFLVLVQKGCVDLVDAVTGSWLLRQPLLSDKPHIEVVGWLGN